MLNHEGVQKHSKGVCIKTVQKLIVHKFLRYLLEICHKISC